MRNTLFDFKKALDNSFFSFLAQPIDLLINKHGENYLQDAEEHLLILKQAFAQYNWPKDPVNAYVEFNTQIIKEDLDFKKKGIYSESDYNNAIKNVYKNKEVMEDYYLTGLYLTYFFWPHHYDVFCFFRDKFIDTANSVEEFMEWGVGHGLLSMTMLRKFPNCKGILYDISPYSISFAKTILTHVDLVNNCSFILEDILNIEMNKTDMIICGEVLEHVPDPSKLLKKMNSSLLPKGKVFLTGAINAAQADHITLFKTPEEIYKLVEDENFRILSTITSVHPFRKDDILAPKVVALIIEKHN